MKQKSFSFSFAAATALLCTLLVNALPADAKPIPPDRVQVMNAIAVKDTIRPHQSAFPAPIRHNLIAHVSTALKQNQPITFFGDKKHWRPLSKIKALTEPGIQLLKLELGSDRFTTGKLTLNGFKQASLYHNGQPVEGKKTEKDQDLQFSLQLGSGDHRLLVLAEQVDNWKKVSLEWQNDSETPSITFHRDTLKQRLSAEQLYDSETVAGLNLAPDGKQLIWRKRHYSPATKDQAISQTELLDVKTLDVAYRWQGFTPGSLTFSPDNRYISYTAADNLYLLTRQGLTLRTLATGLKGAGGFHWLNDDSLIFSWNRSDETGHQITKRYRALEDRWTGWRDNSQLFLLDIHSGFIKQLTDHKLSHTLLDIDHKNNRLLLTRDPVNYQQPAHGLTELIEFDISKQSEKILGSYRTFSGAAFAKNTQGIYIAAGPGFANRAGATLGDNQAVNNYDTQLYLMDKKGRISALSKSFTPSINRFEVLPNGDLLLQVSDQDRRRLSLYSTKTRQFKALDSQVDVVAGYSVSQQSKATIVYRGTSATGPQRVYLKAHNKKTRLLLDTATSAYANTRFGQIKDWDFDNARGETIDGRYYLPPDFDDSKKYPVITYYYGGTAPVSRAFTGRWPFSLWAAQGYIVYVLQPSGATGYGQKFSAKHVNAWGKYSADDIIAATTAFIRAHGFVDGKRVGNIGASYGGFMTMHLATKSKLFRASISHAGISNLAEYWGYGWWGYGYSGVASEGSFPWNNRDLYVEQSPLFNADKITTPLLLLHGDSDTNVPVTESHQMYTALKLLDKEVELIEFVGDNHHINGRSHRLRWWNTILAYFDKQLKDQPLWWETLYPEGKE